MPKGNFINQKQTFSQARQEFDSLLQHRPTSHAIKITFILLALSWLALALFWRRLPPDVPLLYSRPWGEEQLVPKTLMALLPGIATLVSVINLRLASFFFTKEKFFSQLIIWLNLVVTVLAATTLFRILVIII